MFIDRYAMKILNKANIIKRKQVDHTKTERAVLSFTRVSVSIVQYFLPCYQFSDLQMDQWN